MAEIFVDIGNRPVPLWGVVIVGAFQILSETLHFRKGDEQETNQYLLLSVRKSASTFGLSWYFPHVYLPSVFEKEI